MYEVAGATSAAADAAVAAAAAAATAAIERTVFSRLARLDVSFLFAFANAVAAPRFPAAAAAAAGEQQQQQQQQQKGEMQRIFEEQLQRFLPLSLLQKETVAEVYRHTIPRHACEDPVFLLQHWRGCAAALTAKLHNPQQQQQQGATCISGAAAAATAAAPGSAADLLVRELQLRDTAKILQAPAAYARQLIA